MSAPLFLNVGISRYVTILLFLLQMLIPFVNNGHLTPAQTNYNRTLSQCRVRVENGFGRAKGKWRRIKMLHVRNEEIAVDHIVASFVLHNFTVLNGEPLLPVSFWIQPLEELLLV